MGGSPSDAPRLRVALLFGGRSGEHEVSIQSALSVHDALDPARYRVLPVGIERDGTWRLGRSGAIFEGADDVTRARIAPGASAVVPVPAGGRVALLSRKDGRELDAADVVFPIVHGTDGEDGALQGCLRLLDVPFVGPDVAASALAMDKDLSKRVLRAAGLRTARHELVLRHRRADCRYGDLAGRLGLRLFVKPANLGSSVGIDVAEDPVGFDRALDEAFRYDTRVVVEEAIESREIECAVHGNETPETSLPGEIVPRHAFYSYEAKYVDPDGARLEIPAPLDAATTERVRATAAAAFAALGCEGMARVDLFLRPDGEILVNEVNTLPGFTRISMFPKLFEATGLPYPALLDRLIDLARARHRRVGSLRRLARPRAAPRPR